MVRIFLARQPIVGRDGKIFAYELLFRSGYSEKADIEDGGKATAKVIEYLVSSFGLKKVIRDKKGFINIDENSDVLSVADILPTDRVGFEVLETSVLSEDFLNTLKKLKDLGYELSLDDFVYSEEYVPYLDLVDYVKIDVLDRANHPLEEAFEVVKKHDVKVIAEKVETYEVYRKCYDMGFDYFQGYFFQEPQLVTSKTVEPAYAALIKLYNLLSSEAEVKELEKVFKRFSELSVKLLQLINSAYYSLRQPVKSIRHAVLMLGYKNLLKWVLLLMYSLKEEDFTSDPLFEEASVRGFLMEGLARKISKDKEFAGEAFITGVLSLIDVLLGVSMEEVVKNMMLEEDIKKALLYREGKLGDMLSMVEALQRNALKKVKPVMERYNLNPSDLYSLQMEAMSSYAELDL